MLISTERFELFELLRAPYEISPGMDRGSAPTGLAGLRDGSDPARPGLYWPIAPTSQPGGVPPMPLWTLGEISFPAALMNRRDGTDQGWAPDAAIRDAAGHDVAAIWRLSDGSLVLPFDPNEVIRGFLSEAYVGGGSAGDRLRRLILAAYYRLRPLVPRSAQIALRRRFARVQARSRFPRWPYEPAFHDFLAKLFNLVQRATGIAPPWIGPWPAPHQWALVMTHDVETSAGLAALPRVRAVEQAAGVRSSWNFVPRRYAVPDTLVQELADEGFEVGVHGLYHDGRDVDPVRVGERLPEIQTWAERWGAVGFRSPATHRSWSVMAGLGFDYDSSYSDSAPYEPQAGGCCTWWPYFIGSTVELPITLVQDHTLFVILEQPTIAVWREKALRLRDRGGMALLLSHPDYLAQDDLLDRYRQFVDEFADDPSVWRALPREVSAWWRRRAASTMVPDGDGWRVTGPAAADAAVMTGPPR